ncbi:MAG: carbohydrate kinase family protein [Angelakisella sp.]
MNQNNYIVAIGCNAIDEYYKADFFPVAGDKALITHTDSIPGGMIPNAASVMSRLGAECFLLDTLGEDEYTQQLLDDMHHYGIKTDYIEVIPGVPNSKTIIILAQDEKTILVVTNKQKRFITIDAARQQLLNGAGYVYTIIPDLKKLPDYEALVSEFTSKGAKLVIDAENSTFADKVTDRFFFDAASVIIFNEHSLDKYCAEEGEAALEQLIGSSDKIILITLGAEGCRIKSKDEDFSIPAYHLKPVDTTGAGDCFNGTFIYGLTQGWQLKQCAEFATAAAARSILFKGARTGAVELSKIKEFKEKGGNLT